MLDNGRISSVQLLMLLFIMETVTATLFVPSILVKLAGPGAWIAAAILPALYGLLVLAVVLALAKRFPSQTFADYLPEIMGRIPGKLLAIAYALMFAQVGAFILNEGTSLMHIALMSMTPPVVFDVVWAIVAMYGAYLGIEAIVRENQLILLLYLFSQAAILFLVAPECHFNNLKPVFESGFLAMGRAGFLACSWWGEIGFLMLMLYPYLNQKHEAVKTALLITGMTLVVIGVVMVVIVGVFGDLVTAHLLFPYYTLSQYISTASFIERLETLVVVIWVAGIAVKLAVFFHCAAIAGAGAIGLKNYRILLLPIALIMIIHNRFYDTFLKITGFMFKPWPFEALAVELAIPALVLLVAVIRKKEGRQSPCECVSEPSK
jgi:spore germination protein KB